MCFQILTHALHPPCRSLHSANSLSRVHPAGALTLTASVSYMVSQECTNKKKMAIHDPLGSHGLLVMVCPQQ